MGITSRNLLHELGRKAGLIEGRRVDAEFMSYWRRRFSVTLQKCNSKVVLIKVSRLSTNRLMEDNVVSRDSFSASHIEIVELVYEELSLNY